MPENTQSNLVMVNVGDLMRTLWSGKWIIAVFTAVFAAGSVWYALSLSNFYTSTARLTQAEQSSNSLSSLVQQYSGLASVAGLSLGGDDEQIGYAIEVLQSRRFLQILLDKYDILVPLIAADGWDPESNELSIDPRLYDVETRQWVREVRPPFSAQPSLEEAYEVWQTAFKVNRSGTFVSLSLQHFSPHLTQDWLSTVIMEINSFVKAQEVEEAERSINYLVEEVERTKVAESKTLLYDLIQRQTETIMLANVRDEYVFKTIDPPLVPHEKTGPSRSLLCIVITLIGAALGTLVALMRDYLKVGTRSR